jgi:hypothetical protein
MHTGRCGSTVLTDMLQQHAEIFWASEIFERTFRNWEAKGGQLGTLEGIFQPWKMPDGNPIPLSNEPNGAYTILAQEMADEALTERVLVCARSCRPLWPRRKWYFTT